MISELTVDVQPESIQIAITEDHNLVEYQKESQQMTFAVGNVYLGRVRKIMPGLNACFVDIGSEKEAFLHYQDLGSNFNSIKKYLKQVRSNRKKLAPFNKASVMPGPGSEDNISTLLEQGDEILVQVTKEPISTKGPRLTGELSFAGRFLVLIPFTDKVSISSKISAAEERSRLKQLIQSIKPKNCGVIVRTVAEGKRVAELDNELQTLYRRWEDSMIAAQQSEKSIALVCEETSRTIAILRDMLNSTFESIHVNDEKTYKEIRDYVSLVDPEKADIVKLYNGELPIFDNFAITKQIKSSFGRIVSYKGGAYLIIEHTEALHVVDVNSGHRMKSGTQEENALEVNLGAADELARQLRLRDMGGIIVVDFIDMNLAEDRQKLYERMCRNMERDRAKHNILPLSKFGLMQITRQRVRPVTDIEVDETCPTCMGKGKIKPSILFTDQLEEKIAHVMDTMDIKKFRLHVHPYVSAYINQGIPSLKTRWKMKYGLGIRVIPDQSLPFLGYKFMDMKGNDIDPDRKEEEQKES